MICCSQRGPHPIAEIDHLPIVIGITFAFCTWFQLRITFIESARFVFRKERNREIATRNRACSMKNIKLGTKNNT